jgi:hypothetical protein
MRFSEVIQALMAGGGNAVWRGEWGGAVFLRYSEVWNVFELHGPQKRVTQLEELSLSPGDLFANDWAVVVLDPRTGEVAK